MNLGYDRCWALLAGARHGVLGTVHPVRGVDAVPVVFSVIGHSIVVPVDRVKAKRSVRLQRLANLANDGRCVLLIDHYDEAWSQLWWVRVHGRGHENSPRQEEVLALASLFPAYRAPDAIASIITLTATSVSGWAASSGDVAPRGDPSGG
jgi:PPOX class probable F420-dependent enzyme